MFRKLKKLYFKIYHLFKLIGIFIIALGFKSKVYAIETINFQSEFKVSEESCTENLINPVFINQARLRNGQNYYSSCNTCYASQLIKVKPNTTYNIVLSKTVASSSISGLDSETSNASLTNLGTRGGTYTTGNNTNYIVIYATSYAWGDISEFSVTMNEGTGTTEDTFQTTCTPPTPPGPQPNETYTNFISLYTNRMTYLAEGFTNNPYLIVMIGIIIAWVVLELTLKLFNLKGGIKK